MTETINNRTAILAELGKPKRQTHIPDQNKITIYELIDRYGFNLDRSASAPESDQFSHLYVHEEGGLTLTLSDNGGNVNCIVHGKKDVLYHTTLSDSLSDNLRKLYGFTDLRSKEITDIIYSTGLTATRKPEQTAYPA